jgi:hypothetical protein
MILGTIDKKLWVFKVFKQGLARVGICWSQPPRLDHLHKKWRVGKKKFKKKWIRVDCPGVARQPQVDTWTVYPCPFFFEFF